MPFEKYTLKDVAKALNLSTSTVSRALRDSYEISAETKKIVLDYARKINFQVNPVARSLKSQKSNSIGIMVSEIANNFFSQVIEGVESVAYDRNYQVIISQSHESASREKLNVEHFFSRSIDGLLMALSAETTEIGYLESLVDSGYPIVFFDRVPAGINAHKVIANNHQGGIEAVNYLVNKGCRRIAHLTGSKSLSVTKERLEGFKKGLKANGLAFEEESLKYCGYDETRENQVVKAVLEWKDYPYDGIFISGDRLTTGYLQTIKNLVNQIPNKDVKIVGFTNSKVVDIFNPSITAIKQPAFEMGKRAAELLIAQIEARYRIEDFETIMLPVKLMV